MIVYKVALLSYANNLMLPKTAKLLDVQLQRGEPTLWYSFDAGTEEVERQILVFGTGQPAPYNRLAHIATVQSGDLVWHYFENITHKPA